MAQKILSFTTFFIICMLGYYWLVIDESRTQTMDDLGDANVELKGDYNATTEKYDRFDLRLIGHGKHLQQLQKETEAHYARYESKMDSIDIAFDRVTLDIEQLEERLVQKLDRITDEIETLTESFESFKRTNNRSLREIKNDINTLKDDFIAIDKELHPKKYEEKKKK
tara:strand:- start:197 stop:700 length:504 start_codon:yes stop_codon:yes gene_type:complete